MLWKKVYSNAKYASFSKWAKTCKTISAVSHLKDQRKMNDDITESQNATLTLQPEKWFINNVTLHIYLYWEQ